MDQLFAKLIEELAKNNPRLLFWAFVLLGIKAVYRQRKDVVRIWGELLNSMLDVRNHWRRFRSS
jgi:hypothetical protein